jgi:alkylresorcinol/alkylpyrone synthase
MADTRGRAIGAVPRIVSVGHAFPEHYYDQEALLAAFREEWADRLFNLDRLEQLHRNVLVGGRHLALPMEAYRDLERWGQANDAWIEVAVEVGGRAVLAALEQAGLGPEDVDILVFTSVTGVAVPSVDARLVNRLGLRPDVVRVPLFGLGCVAGAAGTARAADLVRGRPDAVVVLLSVELCSLTLQRQDLSIPNLISSGLFGDGAAAAVVVGGERSEPGAEVVASRSVFYPDTERVMGWDISERGFSIVLSSEVPDLVRRRLPGDVDAFLADHDLGREAIDAWIAHPGGPRVLEAMTEALELPDDALAGAWDTLQRHGNLSSTSVLLVLERVLPRQSPGRLGLMTAMGPGFCSELVLLRF